MKIEAVLKDVDVRENGVKAWTTQKYSLTHPRVKFWNKRFWGKGSCWGRRTKLELAAKIWAHKNNFSYKTLESNPHFPMPCCLPWRGKMKHHWGNKRNKCQVATSYRFSASLSNGKRNATCTSHCKVVGMWLTRVKHYN
jgi:hypothetical protein